MTHICGPDATLYTTLSPIYSSHPLYLRRGNKYGHVHGASFVNRKHAGMVVSKCYPALLCNASDQLNLSSVSVGRCQSTQI